MKTPKQKTKSYLFGYQFTWALIWFVLLSNLLLPFAVKYRWTDLLFWISWFDFCMALTLIIFVVVGYGVRKK